MMANTDETSTFWDLMDLLTEMAAQERERRQRDRERAVRDKGRTSPAVRPADWAPRKKSDWKNVSEILDQRGRRCGWLLHDRAHTVELEAQDGRPGRLWRLRDGGWMLQVKAARGRHPAKVVPVEDQHALSWLKEHGWQVVDGADPEQVSLDRDKSLYARDTDLTLDTELKRVVAENSSLTVEGEQAVEAVDETVFRNGQRVQPTLTDAQAEVASILAPSTLVEHAAEKEELERNPILIPPDKDKPAVAGPR
jgi:hypothetical protein